MNVDQMPRLVCAADFHEIACRACVNPLRCRCVRVRLTEDGELEYWVREPGEVWFRSEDAL